MRVAVLAGILLVLSACSASMALVGGPGKDDAAARADMAACNANGLNLHDRTVINCLDARGETITYGDGTIPPFTSANPNSSPMSLAALQQQQSASTAILNRWQNGQTGAQPANAGQSPPSYPPAPSPPTGGIQPFVTDTMYADLKEMKLANGEPTYSSLPPNADFRGENANRIGNYFLWNNQNNVNGEGISWTTDKDLQDFVRARPDHLSVSRRAVLTPRIFV